MNSLKTIAIIPARYQSSRFPGKPLAQIAGKTMLQRVYEQVQASETESASETRRERVQASERGREPEQEPASERGREPASETEQVQASEPASEPAASETEQVLEESIFESEMNLNDENISHNISNEIFGNLQNLISQDISGGNVGMNTYSITISDPSNNDAPILDISYQLFLN